MLNGYGFTFSPSVRDLSTLEWKNCGRAVVIVCEVHFIRSLLTCSEDEEVVCPIDEDFVYHIHETFAWAMAPFGRGVGGPWRGAIWNFVSPLHHQW